MIFGLFGKKDSPAEDAGKPNPYAHLGEAANADIRKFTAAVGKEWQNTVRHRNFDRSPFETQVKLFLEKQQLELHNHTITEALIKNNQLNFNTLVFDAMVKHVATIGELKLLGAFEKLGRKV